MGTVYIEGVVSANSNILDAKLGAWEVLRGFSNTFGSISGFTVNSKELGNTFYIKLDGAEIQNNYTPSTVKKIDGIFDTLKGEGQFESLRTLEETPQLVQLFAQLEAKNNPTKSIVIDEDLDVSAELTEANIPKGKEDVLLQEIADRDTPTTKGLPDDGEEEDEHTSYNPIHRQ